MKFHQVAISEVEVGPDSCPEETLAASGSLLEHYIQSVRESLGVELHANMSRFENKLILCIVFHGITLDPSLITAIFHLQ